MREKERKRKIGIVKKIGRKGKRGVSKGKE